MGGRIEMRWVTTSAGRARFLGMAVGAGLLAMTLGACGDGAATGPTVSGRALTGGWVGGGSLFHDLGWELVQHSPGDSLTGSGYLDAPSFLDGYAPGPNPRYEIRGSRDGLFLRLTFVPEDPGSRGFVLRFEGTIVSDGELRGEVFAAGSGSRLDLVRAIRGAGS